MVGEARAHVQGESLKARAALLTEASQLPDHQVGSKALFKTAYWAAVAILMTPSYCDAAETKIIGNFEVWVDQNPLSDRSDATAVARAGPYRIALRCLEDGLTIAVQDVSQNWETGTRFTVKFRADRGNTFVRAGYAVENDTIELLHSDDLFDDVAGAKSVAFSLETDVAAYPPFMFRLSHSEQAVTEIRKVCGWQHETVAAPAPAPTPSPEPTPTSEPPAITPPLSPQEEPYAQERSVGFKCGNEDCDTLAGSIRRVAALATKCGSNVSTSDCVDFWRLKPDRNEVKRPSRKKTGRKPKV